MSNQSATGYLSAHEFFSRISIAKVDAIIPGLPSQKQVAELTYRQFFRAFKRKGLLLPKARGSFMIKLR